MKHGCPLIWRTRFGKLCAVSAFFAVVGGPFYPSIQALNFLKWPVDASSIGRTIKDKVSMSRNAARTTEPGESPRKRFLNPFQFYILRLSGTEPAWTSIYNYPPYTSAIGKGGVYKCAGCGMPLFDAARKYESKSGWPSFWQPLPDAISTNDDKGFLSWLIGIRTEIRCSHCDGHLGHSFTDGPLRDPQNQELTASGIRYCINGLALDYETQE